MTVNNGIRSSWKILKLALPLAWPRELHLKCCLVLSFLLLGVSSMINVYTPIYDKLIVDSMTSKDGEPLSYRWDLVCVYVLLKYTSCIGDLRYILWSKVDIHIAHLLELHIFSHIHSLSLRWHINRKTGEVLQVINSSSSKITSILNILFFDIFQIVIENTFTICYFSIIYDVWFGLIIIMGAVCYEVLGYFGSKVTSKMRRFRNRIDNETKNRSIDSLLNYETVKYFGTEKYEVNSFKKVLDELSKEDSNGQFVRFGMTCAEEFVVNMTFLITSLMCLHKVVRSRELTLGEYVMFTRVFFSVYHSVSWLTRVIKRLQMSIVDLHTLFEILEEEPEVKDSPNAKELEVYEGGIQFKNVFFEYTPEKPLLRNISFSVDPGKTVALVGTSGSGKTTVLRLLLRFFDVTSGSILIDGQNIKDVTQESLRKAIGVVPQDTVLFNTTIRFNIHYGNLTASEEDIVAAAKAAYIHDRILNFQDGYDTNIGERGLKLSGGEKQRLAVARVLIRAPKIVVLDEATSSLDTNTERNIQDSLSKVCSGRTAIIVAHRLSTIIHADQILVFNKGVIVERGSHEKLLELQGVYSDMWNKQFNSKNDEADIELFGKD